MGAYGTGILDNDTSGEVYDKFTELLKDKLEIPAIIEIIEEDFKEYKLGKYSKTDFIFGLGLALWENCALDKVRLNQIKEFIDSDTDIKIWQELEGSEKDVKKRRSVLKSFLKKIEVPRSKPLKKRKKKVIEKPPVFKIGDCLSFKLANGNYGGAIVIGEHGLDTHYTASNVIITTTINQKDQPTQEDFLAANVLVVNHHSHKNTVCINEYLANSFEEYKDRFSVVAQLEIKSEIPLYFLGNFCGNSSWNYLYEQFEMEIAWEKKIRRKIKVLSIKDVLTDLKLKETRNKF